MVKQGLLRMISYEKALKIMRQNIKVSKKTERINIQNSHMRIISKEILSKFDYPRNNTSAMDGIVIFKSELRKNKILKIVGESKAGNKFCSSFKKNEAKFIYTGAPIPGLNKIVIPKENYSYNVQDHSVTIKKIDNRHFIRFKGEDIKKRKVCFLKNEIVKIRSLSLARTMGIDSINVKKRPNVYVIITGDELITKDNPRGLIESSNEILINMIVEKFGGDLKGTFTARDNEKDFMSKLKKLKNYDLLITSGGISKGKYDIVKKVLKKSKLKILFDQVAVKPGKPTTFGKIGSNSYFLGLPGNPVSCFVSLLFYFSQFVNCFYGVKFINLEEKKMKVSHLVKKNNSLTNFLRVRFLPNNTETFSVYENQDSSMQKILKESDGIWIRKPNEIGKSKNDACNIVVLNNSFVQEI